MSLLKLAGVMGLCCLSALSQSTSAVGAGSTADVQTAFLAAYNRNGFSSLVGAPTGNVTAFLSTGLIQTFPGAADPTQTFALIKPDATSTTNVFQVYPAMFGYYGYLGYATAGFPTTDTANCPALVSPGAAGNTCQWQSFSGDYALFLYSSTFPNGTQNFYIFDPFFTQWNTLGGITVLGPATAVLSQISSRFGSSALSQAFDKGSVDQLNGGPYTGTFTVRPPVSSIYIANGGETGSMGFPVTGEILLANGMRQQAFERGAIAYSPGSLTATQQPPIASVGVSTNAAIPAGGSLAMFPGGTSPVQAALAAAGGASVTARPVVWTSSNPKIVAIQGSGTSVVLSAVASGTAVITAAAEGVSSAPLNVTVSSSYCCAIGQGAPTAAIQQAFQDAVSRSGLTISLPAQSGVTRVGAGYVQQLTGASGATYLIAVPDSSNAGYVVSGELLAAYLQLGGAAGSLGYPVSSATAGGRQMFQNGALAGSPVQLVAGAILNGWQSLGFENGLAGSPTGAAASFVTFRGTSGVAQPFATGSIFAAAAGSLAGIPYLVSGLVLAAYNAAGGAGGNLGAPMTLERPLNGVQRQDFEGGYIYYAPGATQATEVDTPRQPLVTATPSAVRAGTSAHLVLGGFANGATVRVSQTGQPDFLVTTANGTYSWDSLVPPNTAAGSITVKAADTAGTAAAQATYSVYAATSALTITAAGGDRQNGSPGANLPLPLVALVQDSEGNPVAGQSVTFSASPGAQVQPSSAVTDFNGQARSWLRMPAAAGVALATASAGRAVVTFSAAAAATSLTNFPALTQAVSGTLGNGPDTIQNKGALLTAAASILRYYQLRGELPSPNGLADATTLNGFLTSFCTAAQICDGFVTLSSSTEQIVNLWRLGAFVSGSLTVEIESVDLNGIRDLVAAGSPVLLALSLPKLGPHFVVADGIAADGSILIADPSPAYAQTTLNGYLSGYSASLTGAVRLLPQAPAAPGFLVAATASISLSSAAGSCGALLTFPTAAGPAYFEACDGSAPLYELDAAPPYAGALTDLSPDGSRFPLSGTAPAAWEVVRAGASWTVAPLATSITAVLNAASFTNQFAPGGLISIFGAGLAGATVSIGGQSARVVAATPFQVNAQLPSTLAPGLAQLTVTSASGTAQQQISLAAAAPAIFSLTATQAAIANSDNSLNTPSNPAKRGGVVVVYATGFGASTPVTASIGGVNVPVAYAGISPGAPVYTRRTSLCPRPCRPGSLCHSP